MSVVCDIRKFLIEYSGAAGRIIQNQSKRDKKEPVFVIKKNLFFLHL